MDVKVTRRWGIFTATAAVILVFSGCSTEREDAPDPSETSRQPTPTSTGPVLAITAEREPSGLEGAVEGEIVDVKGCLGLQGLDEEPGVLSLPPGTEPIDGGARLPDGRELVLGDTKAFVPGMWMGPEDPGYPEDDYDCLDGTIVLVFTPQP